MLPFGAVQGELPAASALAFADASIEVNIAVVRSRQATALLTRLLEILFTIRLL
jgi:hypothetical protein